MRYSVNRTIPICFILLLTVAVLCSVWLELPHIKGLQLYSSWIPPSFRDVERHFYKESSSSHFQVQVFKDPPCSPTSGRLSSSFMGGLGNQMFQYASMYAIARTMGMIVTITSENELIPLFEIRPDEIGQIKLQTIKQETGGCHFDPTLFNISCVNDTVLCCYLQSWKYLVGYESEIKAQFKFRPNIQRQADLIWNSMITPVSKGRESTVVFVAVHVRRGDKAKKPKSIKYGNLVASSVYLQNGYSFFQNKYGENAIFVVASDDPDWARQVLPSNVSVFVASGAREVDMAVLTRCNHTLMTVGTFGWWIAWLVNGTTVYYNHMFRLGSALAKEFNNSLDHWVLPTWIGME